MTEKNEAQKDSETLTEMDRAEKQEECGINEEQRCEMARLKTENSDLVRTLQRLQAEFENYQKRTEKEKKSWADAGREKVLAKLILLADEFDAAIMHMHRSSESELRNGIRLLQKKLLDLLEEEGVKPIECLGKKFDPDTCDAVEAVEDEGEEGIVAKEMRKGYICNGRVLRHSMVGVTKKKNGEKEQEK